MPRFHRVVTASVFSLALLVACAPNPVAPEWEDAPVVQIVDRDSAEWKRDSFKLDTMVVDGDSIRITVTYGGGCQDHTFALFMSPLIIQTNPAQVELYLRHDGHGDACFALITEAVAFNITPIRDYLKPHYGGEVEDVLLDLYRFEQDEFVQVLYPAE